MTRVLWYILAGFAIALGAVFTAVERPANALPPAGSDVLPIVAIVDVTSRLGSETVALTGWAEVVREAPRLEGGVEVVDLEVANLDLRGASQLGAILVSANQSLSSIGEIRSLQPGQDFPASSTIDVFLDVIVPASPLGSLLLHNETPLRLRPVEAGQEVPLESWPPLGVTYELDPIYGVDNDGDGLIDEDTADDDNDGLIDEDRPGPDPDTPGLGSECGNNPDCDATEGEDPPIELCTLEICDNDGDGLIDEDPDCVPLFNPGGTHLKAGLCVRNLSFTIAPQMPSYSVARGGPSGLHPAEIFALTPSSTSPVVPVDVSGNDDFDDAWTVPGLPFTGMQNTALATVESRNTGLLSPSASAPGATGNGDGYEVSPEEAFADGGGFAEDVNSGIGATACFGPTVPDADSHIFRDFDIDVAALGGNVGGFEVRVDAWSDGTLGAPRICAHLSGDGGANWSSFPRQTGILGTIEGTHVLGSSTDRWRIFPAWSSDELSNENFRVRLIDISTEGSRDFRLDWLTVKAFGGVEPSSCGSITNTVWYRFTPAVSEAVTFDTIGSNFDTVVAVYTGDDVFFLSSLACNDDFAAAGGPSSVSLPVEAGTTYYIQAGGFSGASGDLVLNATSATSLAPFTRVRCEDLGLSSDGCDDGADGDQDDINALSFGADLPADALPGIQFSVGPGSQGVPGSAVEVQRNCPPAVPGLSPEPESDEFGSMLEGTNVHVLDGNGPIGSCSPAFPLGLLEGATVRDDLDALDGQDPSAVDQDGDGVPDSPVYFSLDIASPSLAKLGVTAADVLTTMGGATPSVYASAAALGLVSGDDIDALCLRESGDVAYGFGDLLYFSLAPGSPTLASIGAGPGDILAPGPTVAQGVNSFGLLASDDTNALKCGALTTFVEERDGDVNCSGGSDSIDSALLLQLEAGLVNSLACEERADVNRDGMTNSLDAVLILQFVVGFIDRLPFP